MRSVIVMQVAKEMALSAQRLEEILRIQSPVIFGSLLCKPELDIGEKLLPYIEEALKIEKGRKLSKFFRQGCLSQGLFRAVQNLWRPHR
jgi:hypothetical protein